MHPRRQQSGSSPRGSFFADEIRCGKPKLDWFSGLNSIEDLISGRSRHFSFQQLFNVVGKGEAQGLGSAGELAMQPIRDIANLNHLGHVLSMSHVSHMVKSDLHSRQRARESAVSLRKRFPVAMLTV